MAFIGGFFDISEYMHAHMLTIKEDVQKPANVLIFPSKPSHENREMSGAQLGFWNQQTRLTEPYCVLCVSYSELLLGGRVEHFQDISLILMYVLVLTSDNGNTMSRIHHVEFFSTFRVPDALINSKFNLGHHRT